jgi:hypothetical protein
MLKYSAGLHALFNSWISYHCADELAAKIAEFHGVAMPAYGMWFDRKSQELEYWLYTLMHTKPDGREILADFNIRVSCRPHRFDPTRLDITFGIEPKAEELADYEREDYEQLKSMKSKLEW